MLNLVLAALIYDFGVGEGLIEFLGLFTDDILSARLIFSIALDSFILDYLN